MVFIQAIAEVARALPQGEFHLAANHIAGIIIS
jgi:hypothetical protein